jgi:hypothetical protein
MASALSDQAPGGSLAGKLVLQPEPPGPGELKLTPEEIDGPYFRLGAPMRSNLLEPGDKPELILSGRVLNEKGTPIPYAIVNLWTSDAVSWTRSLSGNPSASTRRCNVSGCGKRRIPRSRSEMARALRPAFRANPSWVSRAFVRYWSTSSARAPLSLFGSAALTLSIDGLADGLTCSAT